MPNYWNPNNFYPATYPQMQYSGMPSQPIQMQPQQMSGAPMQPNCVMTWVPDEMEARGKSMPVGATQFAMWDSNQPKIYLKSLNQMGIPNPMQVLHYTVEESQANLPSGQSGSSQSQLPDMSQYVTKQDLEQLRNELHQMNQSGNTVASANNYGVTGGSGTVNNSSQNRGGNR